MDLERELFINEQQLMYGVKGFYINQFFKALVDQANEHFPSGAAGNPCYMMSQSFSYGLIQGKRAERARRRGEVYDVDPPVKKSEDQILLGRLVAAITAMDAKSIRQFHELALKEVGIGDDERRPLDDLINLIIADKEKEGAADDD